jgi:hypothetical protein
MPIRRKKSVILVNNRPRLPSGWQHRHVSLCNSDARTLTRRRSFTNHAALGQRTSFTPSQSTSDCNEHSHAIPHFQGSFAYYLSETILEIFVSCPRHQKRHIRG